MGNCIDCKQYAAWLCWIIKYWHNYTNYKTKTHKGIKFLNAVMDLAIHHVMDIEVNPKFNMDQYLINDEDSPEDSVLKICQIIFQEEPDISLDQISEKIIDKFTYDYTMFPINVTAQDYLKHSDIYLNLLCYIGTHLKELLKKGLSCKVCDLIAKIEKTEQTIRELYEEKEQKPNLSGKFLEYHNSYIHSRQGEYADINFDKIIESDNKEAVNWANQIIKENKIPLILNDKLMSDCGLKSNTIRVIRCIYNALVMELYRLINKGE